MFSVTNTLRHHSRASSNVHWWLSLKIFDDCLWPFLIVIYFRVLVVSLSRKALWLWSLAYMRSQWHLVNATWWSKGLVIISLNRVFECDQYRSWIDIKLFLVFSPNSGFQYIWCWINVRNNLLEFLLVFFFAEKTVYCLPAFVNSNALLLYYDNEAVVKIWPQSLYLNGICMSMSMLRQHWLLRF